MAPAEVTAVTIAAPAALRLRAENWPRGRRAPSVGLMNDRAPGVGAAAGAEQVGSLAIRQPAIIYLLQRELWSRDGDAFAAGLELACRVIVDLHEVVGVRLPRLSHRDLAAAMEAVRDGGCERQTVRWIRDQIDELPLVLNRAEEDAVATAIAAVVWATTRARIQADPLLEPMALAG